ncbi:FKBP-type peptidyl-prolyl cis-trans isomerase [Microbacterium sp. CIAB417]|uniref:FKBP-type peptidyl-prolyl cis-trans isomerase n=1 Tax=Microbacterium sp. CIAB417 TaxID=2860287 RepID=UPI001FADAFB5|nr:FKBP-type peptidyl-prolyl cis-trans isomerase [Microbacterium sp. CIAB417]
MRTRPIALLSTVAAATLLLAGCSGGAAPESTETPDASADLCAVAAASGDASDSVTIDGTFGEVSAATFELGQTVDELQRTVVSEGDGEEISDGDYVSYALSAFDAETGDRLGDAGYTAAELLPAKITADASLAQVLGCATVGSRLSVAFPTSDQAAAQFYIIDVLGITPTAAWGTEQEPADGMPAVTLADDGEPSVEIPDADAPSDLQISVLKQGDGAAVAAGDTTLLQYHGVNWDTGEVFDSSWQNDGPISIQGNTYVEGFIQALEGQKVGSQVLVVIPPALGYGEAGSSEHELAGQTLVFVIDILANQTAVQ